MRKKKDIVEFGFWDINELLDKMWKNIQETIEEFWNRKWNVWYSAGLDIDDFKEKVEEYAKKYPEAKISAWAFVYDGNKSRKPRYWRFKKD